MSKEVLTEGYKTRERILTPQSAKRFDVILLGWLLTGYILGILINDSGISFSDCTICVSMSSYLPSVHKMAVGSRYSEAMHFIWLYYILSLPLVLILFFIFVREFNRRILSNWGAVLILVLGLSGGYVCVIGVSFGGEGGSGGYSRLYYENLLYSSLVAFSFSAMIAGSIFYLTHHVIGLFKKESINNRK